MTENDVRPYKIRGDLISGAKVGLAAIGADLVESAYPVAGTELDWDHLSRWQANRKSLEDLLQLGSGAAHNLRASVSILAPAASSVIAVLLGTK